MDTELSRNASESETKTSTTTLSRLAELGSVPLKTPDLRLPYRWVLSDVSHACEDVPSASVRASHEKRGSRRCARADGERRKKSRR